MMTRTTTLSLALVTGLLSGALSRYVTPMSVFAQGQSTVPKDIRAQRFTLVDENGKVRGVFAIEAADGSAVIKLFDGGGHEVFSAGPPLSRPVGQR